ncbi:MAG TPA: zinc ribbon domain-containing protein [Candidatus Bathyarchaeia archaeon]|nr:zinc ribbon domain-containing protein [Candidatus Bathyarchaeia archaeon]
MPDPEKPSNEQFCRFCGASTLPNDNFCRHCGAEMQISGTSAEHTVPRPAVQEHSKPSISLSTAVLLIWLLGTLSFNYSLIVNAEPAGWWSFTILGSGGANLLLLLAVVLVALHYYYAGGDTLFPVGWGPLVSILAVALIIFNDAYLYAIEIPAFPNLVLLLFAVFLYVVLLPLCYFEYKKEIRQPTAQMEPEQARLGLGRTSFGVRRRVDELKDRARTMQKRIGRDLTLLIIALPIIFLEPYHLGVPLPVSEGRYITDGVWIISATFLFAFAWRMRASLRKSRFAVINVNRPHEEVSRQLTLEGEREQRAIFLVVFAAMAAFETDLVLRPLTSGESILVNQVYIPCLFLLAALLCFLIGSWAFTGSALGEIHLVEPSAADELGEGVGVMPNKVLKGETHSLLMDFDVVGRPSTNGSVQSGRYYEAVLHAPGVDVDADKRHTLFEPPATLVAMWNCLFRAGGNQAVHVVLEAVTPPKPSNTTLPPKRETLFAYSHDVAVESVFTGSRENMLGLLNIAVTVGSILLTSVVSIKPFL